MSVHQVKRKVMIQKTVSMRNYSRYFYHFHSYHTKILSEDFNPKGSGGGGGENFQTDNWE